MQSLTNSLEKSILHESAKGKIISLREQNDKMFDLLSKLCLNIEHMFDSDELNLSSEELEDYIRAVEFIKPMGYDDRGMLRRIEDHVNRLRY
jgi:hypothetical protein